MYALGQKVVIHAGGIALKDRRGVAVGCHVADLIAEPGAIVNALTDGLIIRPLREQYDRHTSSKGTSVQVASWKHGALSMLSHRDYRRLLAGTVIWWQCFFMEMVVLGWLVFDLSNSARMVSLVGFCRTLPLLLVSLFSGPIIDYFRRRRVVIAAQSANLTAYLPIVLLLWSDKAAP